MYSGHDSPTDGLEKYTFSPPAVPQFPIKNCLRLSNCALSRGVILKLGDLVEQGATPATLAHNFEFVASDKSWLNAVPRNIRRDMEEAGFPAGVH